MAIDPRTLRPRASGVFVDPRSISGLAAWFDASQPASLRTAPGGTATPAADEAIGEWRDLSGNSNHLTQDAANNDQPIRKVAHFNGLDGVEFDGANDFLALTSTVPTIGGASLVIVGRLRATGTLVGHFHSIGGSSQSNHLMYPDGNTYDSFARTTRPGFAMHPPFPGVFIYSAIAGEQWTARRNTTVLSQTSYTPSNSTARTQGFGSGGLFAPCTLFEIAFYSRAITDAEFLQLHTYLSNKWGLNTYSVEYLVIAGGGGGGNSGINQLGAGGGAGGYRTASGFTLQRGVTYTIVVGGGGPRGTNGSDSSFADITSVGGGRGAIANGARALVGGSGGGGQCNLGLDCGGASGTAGQGNAGGNSGPAAWQGNGGGGGAGSAGGNGTGNGTQEGMLSGNGGNGLASSITGTSVTRAGGGGGSAWTLGTPGNGGTGGGGKGAVGATAADSGTIYTGGGGGGGSNAGSNAGLGGSGVVILRIPTARYTAITSGAPTVTTDGTDTILTYTGSGSYTA